MTKKKVARKKSAKKPARKAAVKGTKNPATAKDRVVCYECGRELSVDKWGLTERAIYCCGRVMEKK